MIPSASGLDRAFACRASCVLPQSPDTGSEDADRGSALHTYPEAIANGVPEAEALAAIPEQWRDTARGMDVPAILEALGWSFDVTMRAEEAFAWSVVTGEAISLGTGLDRDYSGAGDDSGTGTADVVVYDPTRKHITVGDYKFGHGYVTRAEQSWQLRALALYAARAYGATVASVAMVRGREDGTAWVDRAEMHAEAIAETATALRGLRDRIAADRASGRVEATPGEHCRYCRCAAACPQGPMALVLASGDGVSPLATTPEGRAKLVQLRILAKRLPDVIDAMLLDAIKRGDTSLPDGQVLAIETTERRKVDDPADVYDALHLAYGADVADVAAPMERHATLTSIRAAAKLRSVRGTTKAVEAELIAACEAAGAVRVSTSETIVAKRP